MATSKAAAMLRVVVNTRAVTVPEGSTLLTAAKAAGVSIPTLCYHPRVKPSAVCRICMVDVQGNSKPVPACYTLVKDGDIVTTNTRELTAYRRADAQLLLARHPNACMSCEVDGNCRLQNIVQIEQLEDKWPKFERGSVEHPEHHLHDHTSPAIQRDIDKCIDCGLCVDICGEQGQNIHAIGFAERGSGALPVTVFDKPLSETNCISCGMCTWICPTGALVEKPAWHDVLRHLNEKRRPTVVQVAPATRVAIGEEFGMDPGTVSTGRLTAALRQLGFDYVFDTNFTADLTIMEEGTELIQRVTTGNAPLPLFTSCCPGWINYLEIHRPDLLPHTSTCKSPQQMLGALAKRGPFAKKLRDKHGESVSPYVVSIMPCTAKKDEAQRPTLRGDIDAVLTTRELAKMIKARRIPFASLSNEATFDSPLGESTGAAQIFGASGGVMEAALRTACALLNIDIPSIDFHDVRGVDMRLKEAEVPGIGRVAVANGIASAIKLFENEEWRSRYVMIEVMSCLGGCLGGGGEPKSLDPDILRKRAEGIYKIDRTQTKRQSHENAEVQQLYKDFLGKPLSHASESLLHTTYAARNSPRDFLGRLLCAASFQDTELLSHLLSDEVVFIDPQNRTLHGKHAVMDHLVQNFASDYRFTSSSEGLEVQIDGKAIQFDVQIDGGRRVKTIHLL